LTRFCDSIYKFSTAFFLLLNFYTFAITIVQCTNNCILTQTEDENPFLDKNGDVLQGKQVRFNTERTEKFKSFTEKKTEGRIACGACFLTQRSRRNAEVRRDLIVLDLLHAKLASC